MPRDSGLRKATDRQREVTHLGIVFIIFTAILCNDSPRFGLLLMTTTMGSYRKHMIHYQLPTPSDNFASLFIRRPVILEI